MKLLPGPEGSSGDRKIRMMREESLRSSTTMEKVEEMQKQEYYEPDSECVMIYRRYV